MSDDTPKGNPGGSRMSDDARQSWAMHQAAPFSDEEMAAAVRRKPDPTVRPGRMSDTPRTWELSHDGHYDLARALWKDEGWPNDLVGGSPVRVVEAGPLRELLIRVEKEVDPRSMLNVEVEAMIRALGGRDEASSAV